MKLTLKNLLIKFNSLSFFYKTVSLLLIFNLIVNLDRLLHISGLTGIAGGVSPNASMVVQMIYFFGSSGVTLKLLLLISPLIIYLCFKRKKAELIIIGIPFLILVIIYLFAFLRMLFALSSL